MMDPTTGRWTTTDPILFTAGDANLYRYVGNNATNLTDPSGLWTWQLGPKGEIVAVSEKDDTLNNLVGQGYPAAKVADLGKAQGIVGLKSDLKAGMKVDLSSLFPENVIKVLTRQQQMDYEMVRPLVELKDGPKDIPKGKTVGNCGIDWAEEDRVKAGITKRYANYVFGWGNCHGFVGLCLGNQLPNKCLPENFCLGALKNEEAFLEGRDKPGTVSVDFKNGGLQVWVFPQEGLFALITGGRKEINKPQFGSIALFWRERGERTIVTHSAFVLGRSQDGDVFLLQKLSDAEVCVITTAASPRLKAFGDVTYYEGIRR